jgi:hypothetical protein
VNSTSVRCTKVKSETCNIIYTVLTSICLSPLQFIFLVAEAIIHIFTAEQLVFMLDTFFILLGLIHIGGWIILGWILERCDGVMWTGLVWLRIGTGGELL